MKRLFYKQIHYKSIEINPNKTHSEEVSILVVYTGGTLGMSYGDRHTLIPFDFEQIMDKMPELERFGYRITVIAFNQLIDSANVTPAHWIALANLITENYDKYHGFVILHGTDTMAYSASALSFLLEDLNKPVIFTGAQLPIGAVRTDARENFITALEIAGARREGRPLVPEVAIFFNNLLLRGNRAKKVESSQFGAFESRNYPPLAEAGIKINYNQVHIRPYQQFSKLKAFQKMDNRVAILKLFPGISIELVRTIVMLPNLRGLVLETYGSGNAPQDTWFLDNLKQATDRGVIIYNVSQCPGGTVMHGRYDTSKSLVDLGIVSGRDITSEAAVTKLMYLLAKEDNSEAVKLNLQRPIRGEMT